MRTREAGPQDRDPPRGPPLARQRIAAAARAAALACALLSLVGCAYAFTRVGGRSISSTPPAEILAAARDAAAAGDFDRGAHLAGYIPEEHPDAPEAEDALYLAAESSFQSGELKDSFELFSELMKRFPASRYSRSVAERDFAIGQAFFAEGTGLFAVFKNRGYGVRVMNHLLSYFPTSDLADDSQLAIAEYHYSAEEYAVAADAFERLADEYPMSEWVEKSIFSAGSCCFLINRGPSYDRGSLLRCIDVLRLYQQRYPSGSFAEQAGVLLAEAVGRMAAKELEIALFYLDQDQDFGARVHLANVVLLFPDTDPGREARRLLDQHGWDTSLNSKDTIRPSRRFGRGR